MSDYDQSIDRTGAAALIPEDYSHEIIKGVIAQSAALTRFRHAPMSRKQQRMPVESVLPIAYFVNGDTGLKKTTEHQWTNKYLNAEEIAVIIPIPEAVLDDVDFDVWAEVTPRAQEALGRVLDAAVFFGTNKPASWPTAIIDAASAAGNVYHEGTATAQEGGLAADISNLFSTVEDDGYDVSGAIASRVWRGRLRNVRDNQGRLLNEVSPTEAYGVPITYPMRGQWQTGEHGVSFVAGDFSQGILGVRQDVTYKVLDQAVITDDQGAVILNLAQQDSVALRIVARLAFQVPNPINYDQPTEADRYPFAVITEGS